MLQPTKQKNMTMKKEKKKTKQKLLDPLEERYIIKLYTKFNLKGNEWLFMIFFFFLNAWTSANDSVI